MYHIFFIHSSIDGHLGCFYVLDTINSAYNTKAFYFDAVQFISFCLYK